MSTQYNREFEASINRFCPAVKFAQGDRRFGRYNGAFKRERHTVHSLAAEIASGHSFSPVLGGCSLEHCGRRFCCYPERANDSKPVGGP